MKKTISKSISLLYLCITKNHFHPNQTKMDSLSVNINMNFQQIIDMIKQLSPSEKLKINDVLWSGNTEIPNEHQKLVKDRMKKTKADPSRMVDWDEASKLL